MKYPVAINTNEQRLAYCFACQKRLLVAFNLVGTWYREGAISLESYMQLPADWRQTPPFDNPTHVLTLEDFKFFKRTVFKKLETKLIVELHNQKKINAQVNAHANWVNKPKDLENDIKKVPKNKRFGLLLAAQDQVKEYTEEEQLHFSALLGQTKKDLLEEAKTLESDINLDALFEE